MLYLPMRYLLSVTRYCCPYARTIAVSALCCCRIVHLKFCTDHAFVLQHTLRVPIVRSHHCYTCIAIFSFGPILCSYQTVRSHYIVRASGSFPSITRSTLSTSLYTLVHVSRTPGRSRALGLRSYHCHIKITVSFFGRKFRIKNVVFGSIASYTVVLRVISLSSDIHFAPVLASIPAPRASFTSTQSFRLRRCCRNPKQLFVNLLFGLVIADEGRHVLCRPQYCHKFANP